MIFPGYEKTQQKVSCAVALPVPVGAGIANGAYSLLSGMRVAPAIRVPDAGPDPAVDSGSCPISRPPGRHAILQSCARLVALYRDQRRVGRLERKFGAAASSNVTLLTAARQCLM